MLKKALYLIFCLANSFPYILNIRPKVHQYLDNLFLEILIDLALQIPFFLFLMRIDPVLDKVIDWVTKKLAR